MSTTSRGLGWEHQQRRAAALRELVPGTPCPFCHGPMFPGQQLDYDHAVPRVLGGHRGPRRLAHSACNRRAGRELQARLIAAAAACPDCRRKVLAAITQPDAPTPTVPPTGRPALGFFDNDDHPPDLGEFA